jgi:hypothetical protein
MSDPRIFVEVSQPVGDKQAMIRVEISLEEWGQSHQPGDIAARAINQCLTELGLYIHGRVC